MPIRLIATDLDGTLLRADHTVHPYAIEQMTRAESLGVQVVIASGRSVQSIHRVLEGYWQPEAVVATNGADVWASSDLNLNRDVLSGPVKERVLRYSVEHDLHLSCYSDEGTFALQESEFLDEYRTLVKGVPVELRKPAEVMELPIFKLVFIAVATRVPLLRAELEPVLSALGSDLTESAPRYLEIMPRGVNKGTGLRHLCRHFGVDPSEIAAIGDYRNDVEMLQLAGVCAAVSNALPEVKLIAQNTVSSNEEGGVGEFIARYVLQR